MATYPDEVFASDEKSPSEIPRELAILQELEEALTSEDFQEAQDNFVEENCKLFEENGDMPPQCMTVYKKYVELIETSLLAHVTKKFPDFDFEELIPVIKAHKGDDDFMHADVFELLSAVLDFESFRDLMVSYNKGSGLELNAVVTKIE